MKNHGGGWNKGAAVGPRTAFTKSELLRITSRLLASQNWHDLCLLAVGVDTMLRASDLLSLTLADVCDGCGSVRTRIKRKQQKTKRNVYPALTPDTRRVLHHWIEHSEKLQSDFLFTGSKPNDAPAIGRGHYARKVKLWALWVGLHSSDYSTHSIRRTKPRHIFQQGESIALISKLLGHKSPGVTLDYLGIEQDQATEATLRHALLPPLRGNFRGKS